jgi:hypothetical protein
MLKKGLLFLLLFFSWFSPGAQDLSCGYRITLLTCAPGNELYSIFGHTAIRVQDSISGADQVFNYGTFEFSPDFYVQFIRGKLLYALSVEDYNDFLYTYKMESRSVVEQELQFSCEEKKKLFTALLVNAKEENRYYRYDFLFDNCTTRAKDMVKQQSGTSIRFRNILDGKQPSFRTLIHSYLDAGNQHWSKLGIDILLGARLDRKVTNEESMFLPDYLLKGFDSAVQAPQNKLVTPPQPILKLESPMGKGFFITPFIAFFLVFVMALLISFRNKGLAPVFDRIFFVFLGLAGLFLLFMWFGTDHYVARNNYNLLWALPTHIVAVFFLNRQSRAKNIYFRVIFWISLLLILTWFFLPQQMNPALLPIVCIIVLRSFLLSKNS